MNLTEIIDLDNKSFFNVYGSRIPVCFEYGRGITLWDTEGQTYKDFYAGVAVNALGHSHPKLVETIKKQAEKIIHCSNNYYIESQAVLLKLLAENSCFDRFFFANSGAEANEGAIKLARGYFKKKGQPEKYEIITMVNSFHGRTLTTTTATGQEKFHKPVTPVTPGFKYSSLNDFEALVDLITPNTCAIMLEPIQGESGINPAREDFVKNIRKLCDEKDILLIFDEIQTGLGRTGSLFAYQHFGVEPDIMTLAKALGGGLPIGALCAKEFAASGFEPGDHGTTFGGNPLACSAAATVLEVVREERLVENAAVVGSYFIKKLSCLKEKYSSIKEIRGIGLMIGIEFSIDKAKEIREELFKKGYLTGSVGSRVLRLLPPLILTKQDVEEFIETLDRVLEKF